MWDMRSGPESSLSKDYFCCSKVFGSVDMRVIWWIQELSLILSFGGPWEAVC